MLFHLSLSRDHNPSYHQFHYVQLDWWDRLVFTSSTEKMNTLSQGKFVISLEQSVVTQLDSVWYVIKWKNLLFSQALSNPSREAFKIALARTTQPTLL